MTTGSNPIEAGTDLIYTSEIADRIEYLEFLDTMSGEEALAEWEDEARELAQLRQVMTDVFGSSADDESVTLISDSYWKRYADEYADEIYDLNKSGANIYFEYGQFAVDYQGEFSELVFDGVTYWYQLP